MEYNEFAKGAATITEIDFARILLRYTFLHAEEYELILERWVSILLSISNSLLDITLVEEQPVRSCIFNFKVGPKNGC